ncbi:MAG: hypothetical protein KH425_09495, partial [Prevotella bivia]|nr:hypothetical protein [Prevotella bivia]
ENWRDFNVNDQYEPGSTFKLIAAAAAIEENTSQPDSQYTCQGSMKIGDRKLSCTSHTRGKKSLAKAIEELHCKHAEIRFLGNDITNEFVSFFLNFFRVSCLRSIILYIDGKHFRVKDATQITETNKKVNKIIICNTRELSFADDVLTTQGTLQYFSQKKWPIDRLIINRAMFAEAFHYNTFYNNKMAIDKIGFIRNDLYLPETYGKFDKCIDICQIVHSSSFRRFWKISPDQIEELKDNALRYAIYPAREIIMSEEKFHIKI